MAWSHGITGGAPPVTIGSLCTAVLGRYEMGDALAWPPDAFALVNRVLDASEAYRFVVSPPPDVVVTGMSLDTAQAVANDWWAWFDGDAGGPPERLVRWWDLLTEARDVRVDALATGGEWSVIETLLALNAVADEACAGLGVATAVRPGPGCRFRAAARELLAETGSLARLSPGILRVLPRCRVGMAGISAHSLSRHVFVGGPQVVVNWHRMPSRPAGRTYQPHANVLLLPWPLRVRARDFRPHPYSLPEMDQEAFGFFDFDPQERLDLTRLEGTLRAAEDEAGGVDVVILPESAVTPEEIEPLEALLARHGVWCLITGVRRPPPPDLAFGGNWVHFSVRHELVWRHAVQHKHHRWCLDGTQITQYHLGGALTHTRRWWEAVAIPPRSLQLIDEGGITIAPLVCEDLARLEPVAELVRSIGPSLVVTLLLDGPQLSSRWTARYASVLADDPGSAVLTLTSYGMVRRCQPPGCEPSKVIALWKDPTRGTTEISLEDGSDAVLITTAISFGDSTTADGRRHVGTTSNFTLVAVQSLAATEPTVEPPAPAPGRATAGDEPSGSLRLVEDEVSKATSWAEAVAEAAAADPASVEAVMADAVDPAWRAGLGLPMPGRLFTGAITALRRELDEPVTVAGLAAACRTLAGSDSPAEVVTGTLVGVALEQRLYAEALAGRLPPDLAPDVAAPDPGPGP